MLIERILQGGNWLVDSGRFTKRWSVARDRHAIIARRVVEFRVKGRPRRVPGPVSWGNFAILIRYRLICFANVSSPPNKTYASEWSAVPFRSSDILGRGSPLRFRFHVIAEESARGSLCSPRKPVRGDRRKGLNQPSDRFINKCR